MTTILDIFGSSNDDRTVSTNEIYQFPRMSCSPNCNTDHLSNKNDLFISESVQDESFQRSPSSFKTLSKEISSPGSFELPSMPSDKSSSRDFWDGNCSVNFLISSDLTDTDRSNSACSLSPCQQPIGHLLHSNDECSLLCSDRTLEGAFYRSVHTDMNHDTCDISHPFPAAFTDTQVMQDKSFQTSCSSNKNSFAFSNFTCNNLDNACSFLYKNDNTFCRPDFQQLCETYAQSTLVNTFDSPTTVCCVKTDYSFTEVTGQPTIVDHSTNHLTSSKCYARTFNSIERFNSKHFDQSSQNVYNHLQGRKTSPRVPYTFVPCSNESEFVHQKTDVQFPNVINTIVPPIYPVKETDSSMSRIKPSSVKSKCANGESTDDSDPMIMGPEETLVTYSVGRNSLNPHSNLNNLAPTTNYIHVDQKQSSPNHNYYIHKTPVTSTDYSLINLFKDSVSNHDPLKNNNKTFPQNLDLRRQSKSNEINSLTKISCLPITEYQDSFASKYKRKSSKVLVRGGKRRKSLDCKFHESVSNHSFTDVLLRLQDVNRLLQDPLLRPSFYLYAPIPSPQFTHNSLSANSADDVDTQSQKYFRFPLSLSKPDGKQISDKIILRFLSDRRDSEEKADYLNHENFLVDAYRRTLVRNSHPAYLSSSPVSQVSPLNLLTHHTHDVYATGCVTPPLHSTVSDKPQFPRSGLNTSKNNQKYREEVMFFDQINSKMNSTCSYCKMQIILPQKAIARKSQDKDSYLSLCSSSCLARLRQQGPNGSTSFLFDANNLDNPFTVISIGESQPLTVFLVKNSHKRIKQASKRLSSQDLKVSLRRNIETTTDGVSLGVSCTVKRWRNIRWRRHIDRFPVCSFKVHPTSFDFPMFQKGLIQNVLYSDTRICHLCRQVGDGSNDVTSRLLNYNGDKWLHLNCILWCYETYETVSGSLMGVSCSSAKALKSLCTYCENLGAGLPCFDLDCQAVYHLPCAHKINCSFHPDRGMYCPLHRKSANNISQLDSLAVERRVYISRDEDSLVEKIISDEDHFSSIQNAKEPRLKLRIGTLILHRIGQLLPEQLASGAFHTPNFIYPVGYWSSRIYWSFRHVGQRCRYDCRIEDAIQFNDVNQSLANLKFTVEVIEPNEDKIFFEDSTCDGVWQKIINRINLSRGCSSFFRILQGNTQGEMLFGLTEPHIIRAIESLPGVDRLSNYLFKFGKLQLIQKMPLAINPTGSARSEPKLRTYIRRKFPGEINVYPCITHNHVILETPGHSHSSDIGSPTYLNSQSPSVISKSQQYRRLRWDWKTNVVLARSRIQGLGLYAARDISKSTFIIEYLGEVIRNEVANRRERLYESQNRGIYMFRVDDDWIVDATMSGGLARYINHSCDPNCTAEILHCDNSNHIVIIANKNIEKGDELTYDYKFDLEEDRWDRIPCLCGGTMPDLSSSKSSTKTLMPTKKDSTKNTDKLGQSSSSRQHDRKYSHPKITRSPPRRRARRSHTSTSSSSESSSSSSDSNSNDSSASDSSNSSKGSKKSNIVSAPNAKSNNERPHSSNQSASIHSKVSDKTLQVPHKLSESGDSKKKGVTGLTSKDDSSKPEGNLKSSSTDHLKAPDASGVTGSMLTSSVQESDDKITEASKSKNRDKTSLNVLKTNRENNLEKPLNDNTATSNNRFTRVLIEKLTKNITKVHIQEIFSVWGEIHIVDLPPDRIHPEFNRGYGYVEYVDPKSASDAVNFMNGGQIDGQEVRVSEVHSRTTHLGDHGGHADERTSYHKRAHESSKHDRERSYNRDGRNLKTLNDSTEHNRTKESSSKRNSAHNTRTHDRQDHSRTGERNRDRERPRGGRSNDFDKIKKIRRGSSGSPFASHSTDRPRSPLTGSHYRRPSPPGNRTGPKRPRSHSPKAKLQSTSGRCSGKPSDANRRVKKASSHSSSSSSSNSGSSSSSSSSDSGSSSSSSSSSSRSHS
ncbi:hypothetical protein MN116_005988 [Schistosoma mekongi]|uniref:Histone-lysine N-methyltransferase n=1 Tax=Schistosoma mekongi TaxID=38744 RepID=A0AAE1ZBM7_SCHME|nr:hypothetical protein MN116_005988 [Schistosoma mekongi]